MRSIICGEPDDGERFWENGFAGETGDNQDATSDMLRSLVLVPSMFETVLYCCHNICHSKHETITNRPQNI